LRVSLAGASNVVLANRHGTLDVLTLDERHFRVLRGLGGRSFRILPADAG
jgi:predicted nucleic acid-binding protein